MKLKIIYVGGISILILLKLWLVLDQPLFAIADNSYDDLLFVRLANYLLQFDWLGTYDNLTLAKGPFYPMWIALAFSAGIPLLLSQQAIYVAACLITERALQPLIVSHLWRAIILVLLLFNPVTFTWQLTRVLRDGLYPGLTLLIVGSAIGLLTRRYEPPRYLLGWAFTCGLATAAFWLTREEGIWILPFLAPLLGWILMTTIFLDRRNYRKISVITLPLLLPLLAIHAVSVVNLAYYGVYTTVELKIPEFEAAYGALTRVRSMEYKPQVPVTKETRLHIYQASTAFTELRPFFERDGFWTFGAVGYGNHPSGSDEIGGGWFMWALRDAAARAGYFGSGLQASGFFRKLADEVNTACQEKRLDCLPERASLMPPWRSEYLVPIVNKIVSGFSMLATFSGVSPDLVASSGSPANLSLFIDLTRERLSGRNMRARGWAVHASGRKLTAALVEPDINKVVSTARFSFSPDIYQRFLRMNRDIISANSARFEVGGRCLQRCVVRILDENGEVLADNVPLKKGPTSWFADPLWIFIDETSSSDTVPPQQVRLGEFKLSLLQKITAIYQLIIPYFSIATLVAFSIWLYQSIRNKALTTIGFIIISITAALCTRLLILAIIDITSFRCMIITYLSPLYPMALLCIGLIIFDTLQWTLSKDKDKYLITNLQVL